MSILDPKENADAIAAAGERIAHSTGADFVSNVLPAVRESLNEITGRALDQMSTQLLPELGTALTKPIEAAGAVLDRLDGATITGTFSLTLRLPAAGQTKKP